VIPPLVAIRFPDIYLLMSSFTYLARPITGMATCGVESFSQKAILGTSDEFSSGNPYYTALSLAPVVCFMYVFSSALDKY
jgi:hypothetical protein